MTIKNFINTFTKGICHIYELNDDDDAFFWNCFTFWDGEWCTDGYKVVLDKTIIRSYINSNKQLCLEVLR